MHTRDVLKAYVLLEMRARKERSWTKVYSEKSKEIIVYLNKYEQVKVPMKRIKHYRELHLAPAIFLMALHVVCGYTYEELHRIMRKELIQIEKKK